MEISYDQFMEMCKPRLFGFGELSDDMIIWQESCAYGTIHVITGCNWSHRGSRISFDELRSHVMRIYIEREFRGEIWEVKL